MDNLNFPMHEAIAGDEQSTNLLNQLWGIDTSSGSNIKLDTQAYLEYYQKECRHALHDGGRHISCRNHRHIIDIAKGILDGRTKEELRNLHSSSSAEAVSGTEAARIKASIDLAARVISMTNIGGLRFGFSAGCELPWERGSLQDLLSQWFNRPANRDSNARLEKDFKGCNLNRSAGIKIVWTNNLADHLRIIEEEVAIFHHASFLKHHRERSALYLVHLRSYADKRGSIFPSGFVDETLETLALLFPQNDKRTIRWLRRRRSLPSQAIDLQLNKCSILGEHDRQLDKFDFWHERLALLKEFYDEYSPRTISQLWRHRRDGLSWHTFWAAILILCLTIFFGIVQSVEGALQVYKAYHPSMMK